VKDCHLSETTGLVGAHLQRMMALARTGMHAY
jgi:hypothetical protein